MRTTVLLLVLFTFGCSTPERRAAPAEAPLPAWYADVVNELTAVSGKARDAFVAGDGDTAAAAIQQGQPLAARVLGVPRPTFAAMRAASDLDDLYGRMLMKNRHYGWARMQFQKNVARWRNWRPESAESVRLRAHAAAAAAECDRLIARPLP